MSVSAPLRPLFNEVHMSRPLLAILLLGAVAGSARAQARDLPLADIALIERAKLFGNSARAAAKISPDGKWLSWIAPRDGVLNVGWRRSARLTRPGRSRTKAAADPHSFWSPDSRDAAVHQRQGRRRNFLLYGVDVASGAGATTPVRKNPREIVGTSRKVKQRILVGINNRDARWHDVHSLDLASGS
jgi:hypothetical protein